jgi:hypothetical protein
MFAPWCAVTREEPTDRVRGPTGSHAFGKFEGAEQRQLPIVVAAQQPAPDHVVPSPADMTMDQHKRIHVSADRRDGLCERHAVAGA